MRNKCVYHFVVFFKKFLHFLGLNLSLVLSKKESNMEIINGRERRRIKTKRGVLFHLFSDVDLRQSLQLGGVFWHICGQQTHTANKDLQGKHVNVEHRFSGSLHSGVNKVHTCRIHL